LAVPLVNIQLFVLILRIRNQCEDTAMDAQKVQLVQQSFEQVAAMGLPAAELFYAELFAIDPSLQDMFSGNMQDQHKKLLAALALVIRSLNSPEKIIPPVQQLAVKHVDYGVLPEHYTLVGNALLRTLKKAFGEQFTPELRGAWTDAFRMLAQVMKDAAYGDAKAGARSVA
jgi:nitric oxide dioxygenase